MKFILGFFRFIFTIILTAILLVDLLVYGLVSPISSYVSDNNIEVIVEDIVEGMAEDIIENPDNETNQLIQESLDQMGISSEQAAELLNSEDVQSIATEVITSALNAVIEDSDAVAYPTIEEVSETIYNHIDVFAPSLGIENPEEIDINQIKEMVTPYYDDVTLYIDDIVQGLLSEEIQEADSGNEVE